MERHDPWARSEFVDVEKLEAAYDETENYKFRLINKIRDWINI